MNLLSLQYCIDLPSSIRGCIDGVFILRETSPNMRKKLFENFGSCCDNQHDWNDLMDGINDNYTAMFINYKIQSSNIEDCVFYFKADPNKVPKDWKFGCKDYWDYHYERYDQNYTDQILT